MCAYLQEIIDCVIPDEIFEEIQTAAAAGEQGTAESLFQTVGKVGAAFPLNFADNSGDGWAFNGTAIATSTILYTVNF